MDINNDPGAVRIIEQIQTEQNAKKLTDLVDELTRLLDEQRDDESALTT
jgi:hypothetical protein